jgi:predicted nucleotide-binding protein (sugar kinase/HSP70/actin superfamily)
VLMLTRPYHTDPQIHHKAPDILADFGVDVLTEDAVPLPDEARLDNKHIVSLWQFSNRALYAARWACQQPDVEVVQLNSFGCGPDAIAVDEARNLLNEHGKGHTIIRVDEIESTGSTRLRLRSMVESMKRAKAQKGLKAEAKNGNGYMPRKVNRLFQKGDNQRRTIIVPDFSRFTTLPIIRPIMDMGYKMEILPPPNRESVEIGLKYVNNEVCYPAIIVIGDIIKGLQSGRYNIDEVATGLNQTGGMCRETCYLTLLKNALVAAGFGDVPVISVSTNLRPLNEQPGMKLDYPSLIHKLMLTIPYADAVSAMYHASVVRELLPGSAQSLAYRYMDALGDPAVKVTPDNLRGLLQDAVADFNALPQRPGDFPLVGLVGEIYVKMNPFGGANVVPWLTQQGFEVVIPSLTEFFTSGIISMNHDLKTHVARPSLFWLITQALSNPVKHYASRYNRIMQDFQYYRPAHTIEHIAEKASEILSLSNHYGEGWIIAGEIGTMVEAGINNILCLQPFGCLANHIVAKGVQNRIKTRYPDLNLLFLDTDAGNSEVNFYNRMHFFTHHAREFA